VDFQTFFKEYVSKFQFITISTEEFKDFFLSFCDKINKKFTIYWDRWFDTPGMPDWDGDNKNNDILIKLNLYTD